ncbi:MAG: glutamate racemase [Candidatus Omnitrophica bacterium]|nr:glutamate racemase [Candidatus Omnitrophota bacterium]
MTKKVQKNKPIGVFDSGLGGLTVVFNLQKSFPEKEIIYFGDTARLPYGNKSPETIQNYARQNTRFLLSFQPEMVVVACHTASALALGKLKTEFSLPIVGVLAPAVKAALAKTRNGRIGIIGTSATVKSNSYPAEIKKANPKIKVYGLACPLFVPLVEEGLFSGPLTNMVVAHYLKSLKEKKIDTLILGCTHYPMLKAVIAGFMGPKVTLVDPSEEVMPEIAAQLKERGQKAGAVSKGGLRIYLSDITPNFRKVATSFLKKELPRLGKANVENL